MTSSIPLHSNSTLSNAQKMQYLKSSVIRKASNIFCSLEISDANYEVELHPSDNGVAISGQEKLCRIKTNRGRSRESFARFSSVEVRAISGTTY